MSKKNGAGKFVLGAAIGAAIGLLFSPKTGKENRKIVKEKADDLIAKAKVLDVNEVKENIEEKVSVLIEELKSLDKEKALDIAKKKAKEIKKTAEELADYTKEKATPVIEEAAEVLKEKAIDVTKKVLDKLENEK